MGFVQLLECDGCGDRGAEPGGYATVPDGWQVRSVAKLGSEGRNVKDVIAVCPECWTTKTLAEVLGS